MLDPSVTSHIILVLFCVCAIADGFSLASERSSGQASEEQLIGWQGETWLPSAESSNFIETLSWSPRAVLWHGFITDEEARHVMKLGQVNMRPSTVVGPNGSSVLDPYRTSYGTFLARAQDPVIAAIEQRIALWTHLPAENQEEMQVLRYANGQKYDPHQDSLDDDTPRLATVLVYLTTPEEGGETVFSSPTSQWADPQAPEVHGPFSACATQGGGVAAKAKRGDALLFWSIGPDGKEDPDSEHAGCPVFKGVKWSATKWVHPMPFGPEGPGVGALDPGVCMDKLAACSTWVKTGECERNSLYMVGNADSPGVCRLSCRACEVCAKHDKECYIRNRRALGLLIFDESELD